MKTLDVVIPVHNSVHWLAWCLEELFRFEVICLKNVFVVNDRSETIQTNKLNEIIARYPKAHLITNENDTGGFGYACNLAASKCSSEIILFLNTDCLVTEGMLDRLCATFDTDPKIVLACPFSNNSPNLTYPMFPGFSYRDMSELFANAASDFETDNIIEVCTIVGNCLMVRRDFFEEINGFSSEWGIGYGEETDLHMKAFSLGLKGVVNTGCYVYHFGGGTFNYEAEIETHRKRNYDLFMNKWAKEYKQLASKCESINPIHIVNKKLKRHHVKQNKLIELDVLFYLPGISQSVGGVNAVIAVCNDLIRRGLKVSCALIGTEARHQLKHYEEPVLFNFLYFDSDEMFLSDRSTLPKVVFSTIFCSAPVVSEFAANRNAVAVQFIQGYECYFENGTRYVEAQESYKSTDHIVTTSDWLCNMVSRHLSDGQDVKQLPLVVNTELFFSGNSSKSIDVVCVFRSSPDKGQWVLAEILDRLALSDKSIAVLCAAEYSSLKFKYENRVQFIDLPVNQYSLAKILQKAKVFVDTSLHEGYGLIPLEAALCGCNLVLSDSGGVRDFINSYKGQLITHHLDSESIIDAINFSLDSFDESAPAEIAAKQTYSGELWFEYFQHIIKDRPLQTPKSINISESKHLNLALYQPNLGYPSYPVEMVKCDICSDGTAKKIYKKFILPNIPDRLHLALKILWKGKI